MTDQETRGVQRRLSALGPFHVQEEYKAQIGCCKLQGDEPNWSVWPTSSKLFFPNSVILTLCYYAPPPVLIGNPERRFLPWRCRPLGVGAAELTVSKCADWKLHDNPDGRGFLGAQFVCEHSIHTGASAKKSPFVAKRYT
jgi:hypothetical protein